MINDLFANNQPEAIAISVAGGGSTTYGSLIGQVERLARQLNELGLGRHDRIAIALPNGLETIVSFLAAATAGIAAPLNQAYRFEEFKFYLEDTHATALIVPPGALEDARKAAGSNVVIIDADLDSDGEVRYQLASSNQRPCVTPSAPGPDDIALMLHTSGTTSRPKRVPLRHGNLTTSARNVAAHYHLTSRDVSVCVMPLFHVHGLVASTLATFATGGKVVVVPKFNPLSFWSTVAEHQGTWYSAVPTIHQLLLARSKPGVRPRGAESLRFIRSCSSALAPQVMADMEERFGAPVVEAYGMTEAAHQMAANPLPPAARKPGSVGPGSSVEVGILDEKGTVLPAGQIGEISIKGANVFSGYEENPQANAASFTNGWFRTGDQGYLDPDGYLVLVGRIKELIIRGGEKISPREVDELLLAHPAVAEAVCYAMPDKMYGEEVAAAVVLKAPATAKELVDYCKSVMAAFKAPKTIQIMESIPRTATGKVQRRNVAAEILKLQSQADSAAGEKA